VATILVSAPTARRWTPIALPVLRLPRGILQIAPLVLALLASPALYLSVTSEAVTTGATVERLRTEREQWRQQNRQLEYELAKLQSLAWVENEAVTRLEMRRAAPAIYMIVDRARPAPTRFVPASLARREADQPNPFLITPHLAESAETESTVQVAPR
jgi:hypothetical protein